MKLSVRALLWALPAVLATACFENPSDLDSGPDTPPARVERNSADGQSAVAGSEVGVPPAVLVTDERGGPLAGVTVQFQVIRGGGSLGERFAVTNLQGIATAESWTLGSEPGSNEVVARVGNLPVVRFFATGVSSMPPPDPNPVPGAGQYHIRVRYLVTASLRQQQAVTSAVARWQTVITGDLQDIPVNATAGECFSTQPAINEMTDDLLLYIEFVNIDGAGKTLGEAGPCYVRSDNRLPVVGRLKLDVADLQLMESNGTLDDVVLHEIGHVLGIGTLWPDKNLLSGAGTDDPGFTGALAINAYRVLGGQLPNVPVENTGSTGTRDGHWRESVFGNELMTGWINRSPNPMSEMTIASLQDLGYNTNPGAAGSFTLGGSTSQVGTRIDLHNREQIRRPRWSIDRQGRRRAH